MPALIPFQHIPEYEHRPHCQQGRQDAAGSDVDADDTSEEAMQLERADGAENICDVTQACDAPALQSDVFRPERKVWQKVC